MNSAAGRRLDADRTDHTVGSPGPRVSVRGELVGWADRRDPRSGQTVRVAILATGGAAEGVRRLLAGLAFVAATVAALALAGLVASAAWPPSGLVRTALQLGIVVVPLLILSTAAGPALGRVRALATAAVAAAGHAALLGAVAWLSPGHATLSHWAAAHPLIALWAWGCGTAAMFSLLGAESFALRLGARIELPVGAAHPAALDVDDLPAGLDAPAEASVRAAADVAPKLEPAARR